MDDPFINQAYSTASGAIGAQKPTLSSRAGVRIPPAVKGTLDRAYRFPSIGDNSARSHSANAHASPSSLTGQIPKTPIEYADSRSLNDPNTTSEAHVRDPNPYTGFIAPSSKTELLMQNLQNLKLEGDIPSSSRTVLYDPVTQGQSRKSSIQTETAVLPPLSTRTIRAPGAEFHDFHHDLLKASEPLPPTAQQNDYCKTLEPLHSTAGHILTKATPGANTQQTKAYDAYQSENAKFAELVFEKAPTQEEKDAAIIAWFTGKDPKREHLRGLIECRTAATQGPVSTPPQQRTVLAPIGSGRNGAYQHISTNSNPKVDSTRELKAQQRAANDIMIPVLANLHEHMLNDPNDPFTRYAQPPAWCIDTTPGGNKSLMGETEWNPPPRVGRDPRYPTTFHEGRPTYFEEVGRGSGRR